LGIKYFTGYWLWQFPNILPPAARLRLDGYAVVHKVLKYRT